MPQIPAQTLPTVMPAGAPGVFQRVPEADASAFGALTARGISQVGAAGEHAGNTAADIAIMFQKQYNETATDAANSNFEGSVRDVLFGKDGFYTKKGSDALNAMKPTEEKLESLRQEVHDSLANPEQQRMFDYMSRRSAQRELYQMQGHATTEFKVWQGETAQGSIKNEVDDSATNWNDSKRFAQSLANIKIFADKLSVLKGIDPNSDAGKAAVTHYQGEAWSARIHSVMAHDPSLARQLFDQNSDQIDAAHRAQLDSQIASHEYTWAMRSEVRARRQKAEDQRILKQVQDQRQDDMLMRWNKHQLTPDDVVNDKILTFPQKHVMLGMLNEQAIAGGQMHSDNAVFLNLLNRIHLPDSNQDKITDENKLLPYVKARGGIDYEALQKLRKEVRDIRDPEQGPFVGKMHDLFKVAESDLTKTNNLAGIKDPKGDQLLYDFKWEADKKIAEWKAQGKDPFELMDPKNPNYLGNLLAKYRRTPQQIITDMANEMRAISGLPSLPPPSTANLPPVPKAAEPAPAVIKPVEKPAQKPAPIVRKPGESAADFLKRKGK
jgi:hypothetical protein